MWLSGFEELLFFLCTKQTLSSAVAGIPAWELKAMGLANINIAG